MDNLPPEERVKIFEAIKRMGEKLVRLGLTESSINFDHGGVLRIKWTERGLFLRNEMRRVFGTAEGGEAFDIYELQAFISILTEARDASRD